MESSAEVSSRYSRNNVVMMAVLGIFALIIEVVHLTNIGNSALVFSGLTCTAGVIWLVLLFLEPSKSDLWHKVRVFFALSIISTSAAAFMVIRMIS